MRMVKRKVIPKKPSRARYEKQHPVFSARLDRETYDRIKSHLAGTGCSFADLLKDAIGREESMVEERVQMLTSRKAAPSLEDRVRCLEDLVHQLFSVAVTTHKWLPICPHCHNQELLRAEGTEAESTFAIPQVLTWHCPRCGFFLNTFARIDPKSLKWVEPNVGQFASKPAASAKSRRKK